MTLPLAHPASGNYKCDLFTHRYMFSGEITAGGPLLRYLLDPTRAGIRMIHVTATLLEPGASSMSNFQQDELIIIKEQVVFMRFDEAVAAKAISLSQTGEQLLVYTERFVIQGQFQTSSKKDRLIDAAEGPLGRWAQAYHVFLHPLIPTAKSAPVTAKLILLNKEAIQFFHPAQG